MYLIKDEWMYKVLSSRQGVYQSSRHVNLMRYGQSHHNYSFEYIDRKWLSSESISMLFQVLNKFSKETNVNLNQFWFIFPKNKLRHDSYVFRPPLKFSIFVCQYQSLILFLMDDLKFK